VLVVSTEQEDEVRAFCNLVSRRAPSENRLAWVLARFEMGCERATDLEALSDHLLALRALLEPEWHSSGLLAPRLAALCATPAERPQLIRRLAQAFALERAAIEGNATERAGSSALAGELAGHLRALLRDVICGHLPADLVALADELLAPREPSAQEPLGEEDLGDTIETGEILNVPV
jgi:predicted component of type VI protein secretion system